MPSMCAYDVNSILCSNSIARKQEGYSAAAITRELQKTFGTLSYKRVLTIIKAYKQQKAGNIVRPYSRRKFTASEVYEIKTFMSNAFRTDNSITARRMIKMIQESLAFQVKPTMLKVFRKELRLLCKSTKSGHLIRSGNKEKRLQFCNRMLELKLLEGDQLPSTHSMFTYGQGYHVEEDRFVCGTAKRVYSLFIIHLDLYTANFSSGSNGFRTLIAVY
uniref:HTH_Tnp_Tc3_2 domain-containing protein n=1 Tax=Heterorhabditis bacteriophora TaxID=37862 RepID=A0A1I7X4M4_HETBA